MDAKSAPNEQLLPHLARAISAFGRVYNGHEASGVGNIPLDKPALLVFYHGLNPLDAWYFGLRFYLDTGILIRGLGDRWLFKTPGLGWLVRAVGAVPGSPGAAVELLKAGHLVGVSPGGVREAISGSGGNYQLKWGNRVGFARVALEAGVDIIPVFTENIEELYRAPFAHSSFIQNLYEKTRLPLVPIVGLGLLPFPVKLRTWVGEPVKIGEGDTPKKLADRVQKTLQALIDKHQDKGQSVLGAVVRRFLKLS